MPDIFDIAVIGGGMTGLTAAHHAALAGARVLHARSVMELGGLVTNVGRLDGFPALGPVSGVELANCLSEANAAIGVQALDGTIESVDPVDQGFELRGATGKWRASQVIGATGARLKPLDVPGAQSLRGRGISYCGWCDGGLFRGKDIVVVGGGDSAFQEALHLAQFAAAITVVTHAERFSARPAYVSAASENDRFSFRWNAEIAEIVGADKLEGVRLRDRITGTIEELACDGLFVFIGLEPGCDPFGVLVERDADGFVCAGQNFETKQPGIFAAGAMRSGYMGQLTNAMGEGTTAARVAASRRTCR